MEKPTYRQFYQKLDSLLVKDIFPWAGAAGAESFIVDKEILVQRIGFLCHIIGLLRIICKVSALGLIFLI